MFILIIDNLLQSEFGSVAHLSKVEVILLSKLL